MNSRMQKDAWIYRTVVVVLGLTVIGSVIGAIILAVAGVTTPELVITLGSTPAGGLAGLLAPSPLNR
jgi:hypothetical protein